MSGKNLTKDHPHTGLAVFSAGVMALALAMGLSFLGLVAEVDRLLASLMTPDGMALPQKLLPPYGIWVGSALLAFLLPAIILNVPGLWRRLVVWVLTCALTLAWAPVMWLAAFKPELGVALVAVFWSGFCAMFYCANHVLPVDITPSKDHGAS